MPISNGQLGSPESAYLGEALVVERQLGHSAVVSYVHIFK